ncbi:regulatory protein, luxR family [Actinokineospora alba]|uniref:Regulatory protein, luxR family n=1 Tax=Actinokineospora alba TaxID=504798 RepID=A0A1H0G4R9_9PSEU|nr:LuxR C-terminal-related transcriptional regulator [Actinokineospora alba]TDP69760.1 regulatory LuxR family protein [Actinokineospora alba]SDI09338.1 regulatory protein, luxR family [Actinokineospora alba]SDO01831.1 regulatory protein, luxR family [Actinokineospora alba]
MRLVGAGVLRAVLAAGLAALGWTCVRDPAGLAVCAAVIVHEHGVLSSDLVAECVAHAMPTVVVGSVRCPRELIIAVRAGATSVVDRDLPVPELLAAVQQGLTDTSRHGALVEGLRLRMRLQERLDRLTPRERTVLTDLAAGLAAAEIAHREHVSLTTVRTHIRSILLKLNVSSQLAAVAAGRAGWRELNLPDHAVHARQAVAGHQF